MNERDRLFMNKLLGEISERENGKRILLSVKYNQIHRVNLIILRALIQEMGKRGLFVTVDRPHRYMEYLLDINNVPRESLLFLDIIGRFSGERGIDPPSTNGKVDSPFFINDLLDLLENGGGRDGQASKIDFGLLDFVMIDNLVAMLPYNEARDVTTFIQRYLGLIERYGKIFTAIVLDVRAHGELYESIRGLCQKELTVTDTGGLAPLQASQTIRNDPDAKDEISESVIIYSPEKVGGLWSGARPQGV